MDRHRSSPIGSAITHYPVMPSFCQGSLYRVSNTYKTPRLILSIHPYTNPVRNVFVLFLHLKHLETGGVTLWVALNPNLSLTHQLSLLNIYTLQGVSSTLHHHLPLYQTSIRPGYTATKITDYHHVLLSAPSRLCPHPGIFAPAQG
jgi:hypothetical protein